MRTQIKNIKELVGVENTPKLRKQGKEMARLETIKDAYLLIEDCSIKDFGPMSEWNGTRCGGFATRCGGFAIRRCLI